MADITWTNVQPAVELLWPSLKYWANRWGYAMPTIEYALEYRFTLLDASEIGYNSGTTGNFNEGSKTINIAFTDHDKRSKMYTLIHELAHLVQYFNLQKKFSKLYSAEKKEKGYYKNQFEIEARDATRTLDTDLNISEQLKKAFKKYNWQITRSSSICYGFHIQDKEWWQRATPDWKAKKYFGTALIYK